MTCWSVGDWDKKIPQIIDVRRDAKIGGDIFNDYSRTDDGKLTSNSKILSWNYF